MSRFLPILFCLAVAASASAQEQESGLLQRLEGARPDSKRVNPMQFQSFKSAKYSAKAFGTSGYGGTKDASLTSFSTRSFLGLKNPWLGRRIYDTSSNPLGKHTAKEAGEKYQADAFAVKSFTKAGQENRRETTASLPAAAQPRPYLVAGKTQQGLDRYTQNLEKDLTIEDVRDLLNKGRSE